MYLVINPVPKTLPLINEPVWFMLSWGTTMVTKSSGLLPGAKRDFGAQKMFVSYLSDSVRDGTKIVCADTRALDTHWAIRRVSNATAPFLLRVTSWYHNDVTSFQDDIGFQILSSHNV